MNAKEMIQQWRDADRIDVEQFNSEFAWGNPPLEAQVSFLRFRLHKTMGMLSFVLDELAKDRDSVQAGERQ